MNKCINPQCGVGNIDLNLHTGVHLSFPEKPYSPISFGHQGPLHIAMPIP